MGPRDPVTTSRCEIANWSSGGKAACSVGLIVDACTENVSMRDTNDAARLGVLRASSSVRFQLGAHAYFSVTTKTPESATRCLLMRPSYRAHYVHMDAENLLSYVETECF